LKPELAPRTYTKPESGRMQAAKLFLTNTLSGAKEAFAPADPKRVTMYVCGPTVYDHAHIGNMRPVVAFDVLFRLLRHIYGADAVVYGRNFTDIDDRIILKARDQGVALESITGRYTESYLANTDALGALRPTHMPRATAHVGGMIGLIDKLIACGCAYRAGSGVYFAVAADDDYGKLSGRTPDEAAQARIEGEDDKRAAADFALWKAAKPGEPAWEAPFGAGRPGWHIECSAMIAAELGETIDIHAGGIDLVFPHHENEIAQSESASGKPLARYWLHNGFLDFSGEKMSKSLGNVVLPHELLEDWPGEVLRWALLSAHYRAPLEWNRALLEQAKASLDRLYGALDRVWAAADLDVAPPAGVMDALCDDLSTPRALAALFALASEANKSDDRATHARLKAEMIAGGALLGLLQANPKDWFGAGDADAAEIDALVAARVAARAAKNWAEADRLRAALAGRGVEVMDGPGGSTWRRIG
jgi:cysteinyl-tRNA synthetase